MDIWAASKISTTSNPSFELETGDFLVLIEEIKSFATSERASVVSILGIYKSPIL